MKKLKPSKPIHQYAAWKKMKPTTAFCHDRVILSEVKRLVKAFDVKKIVETGTYIGHTTKVLAGFGIPVHTTEINADYQQQAKEACSGLDNIVFHNGDSPQIVNTILANNKGSQYFDKFLYFLDSHWLSDRSLERELETIAKHRQKPIILIHDFKVPGTDLGFDSYNGQDYEFEWIKPYLDKVYGEGNYHHYFNEKADPKATHKRGCLFVVPGN